MTTYRPVVVIGSVRSGTNMLRDLVTGLPGHATWPCDELPFVWRYGNRSEPHDELLPEHARSEVVRYIRRTFSSLADSAGVENIVEKTCANSLRVPFVDAVLPEARYIFIVRDGRDAVASAMERWRARMDLRYTLRKARYVPIRDVPYYGLRYVSNRLHKLRSPDHLLKTWGPRFNGIDEMVRTRTLAETCATQWRRCVDAAVTALREMDPERVHTVRYEDLVTAPAQRLSAIAEFLDTRVPDAQASTMNITASSVGSWHDRLTEDQIMSIEPIVRDTLHSWGYAWDTRR